MWLNFENILSVWKWLKIIVSIAISMSSQQIYVSSIYKDLLKYRICHIVIFKIKGKNICSWRIGIVNTKYPKKGWLYEIEDSHYGWDFAYSINVEQDQESPTQRPSPVNILVLHSPPTSNSETFCFSPVFKFIYCNWCYQCAKNVTNKNKE